MSSVSGAVSSAIEEPIDLVSDDEQHHPVQQQPIVSAATAVDVTAANASASAPKRAAVDQDIFFPPASVPPMTAMLPAMTMCFGAADPSSTATASTLAMANASLQSRAMLGSSSLSAPPRSQLHALPLAELEDPQVGPCNSDTLELGDRVVGSCDGNPHCMGRVVQLTRKTSGQTVGSGIYIRPGQVRVEFDDANNGEGKVINVDGDTLRWLPKQLDEKHRRRAEEQRRKQEQNELKRKQRQEDREEKKRRRTEADAQKKAEQIEMCKRKEESDALLVTKLVHCLAADAPRCVLPLSVAAEKLYNMLNDMKNKGVLKRKDMGREGAKCNFEKLQQVLRRGAELGGRKLLPAFALYDSKSKRNSSMMQPCIVLHAGTKLDPEHNAIIRAKEEALKIQEQRVKDRQQLVTEAAPGITDAAQMTKYMMLKAQLDSAKTAMAEARRAVADAWANASVDEPDEFDDCAKIRVCGRVDGGCLACACEALAMRNMRCTSKHSDSGGFVQSRSSDLKAAGTVDLFHLIARGAEIWEPLKQSVCASELSTSSVAPERDELQAFRSLHELLNEESNANRALLENAVEILLHEHDKACNGADTDEDADGVSECQAQAMRDLRTLFEQFVSVDTKLVLSARDRATKEKGDASNMDDGAAPEDGDDSDGEMELLLALLALRENAPWATRYMLLGKLCAAAMEWCCEERKCGGEIAGSRVNIDQEEEPPVISIFAALTAVLAKAHDVDTSEATNAQSNLVYGPGYWPVDLLVRAQEVLHALVAMPQTDEQPLESHALCTQSSALSVPPQLVSRAIAALAKCTREIERAADSAFSTPCNICGEECKCCSAIFDMKQWLRFDSLYDECQEQHKASVRGDAELAKQAAAKWDRVDDEINELDKILAPQAPNDTHTALRSAWRVIRSVCPEHADPEALSGFADEELLVVTGIWPIKDKLGQMLSREVPCPPPKRRQLKQVLDACFKKVPQPLQHMCHRCTGVSAGAVEVKQAIDCAHSLLHREVDAYRSGQSIASFSKDDDSNEAGLGAVANAAAANAGDVDCRDGNVCDSEPAVMQAPPQVVNVLSTSLVRRKSQEPMQSTQQLTTPNISVGTAGADTASAAGTQVARAQRDLFTIAQTAENESTWIAQRDNVKPTVDKRKQEVVQSLVDATTYHTVDQGRRLERLEKLLEKWDVLGLNSAHSDGDCTASTHELVPDIMRKFWGVTDARYYPRREHVVNEVEELRAVMDGRTLATQGVDEGHWADVVPSSLLVNPLRTEINLQQHVIERHEEELNVECEELKIIDPFSLGAIDGNSDSAGSSAALRGRPAGWEKGCGLSYSEFRDKNGGRRGVSPTSNDSVCNSEHNWMLVAPHILMEQQDAIRGTERRLKAAKERLAQLQQQLDRLPVDIDDQHDMQLERAQQVTGITAEQWRQKLVIGLAAAERFLNDKYRSAQRELGQTYGTDASADNNPLKSERQKLLNHSKQRLARELQKVRDRQGALQTEDSENLADFLGL